MHPATADEPAAAVPEKSSGRAPSFLVVLGGTLFQLLFQFLLQTLLAEKFGAGIDVDAMTAASTIPIMFAAILATPLATALIPALQTTRTLDAERGSAVMLGQMLALTAAVSLLLTGVFVVAPEWWMSVLQPGFDRQLAPRVAVMFRIMIWLLPLNTLVAITLAALQAQLRFTPALVAGIVGPLVTCSIVISQLNSPSIQMIAWGIVVGACVTLTIQCGALAATLGWSWTPSPGWPVLLKLALPLMLGTLVLRADPLIDRAAASFLSTGTLSHLRFSGQLTITCLSLTSGVLSTIAFPRIAAAVADPDRLCAEVSDSFRTLVMLILPAAAVVVLFPVPLVRDLFQRGRFTETDTLAVASMLAASVGIIVGAAAAELAGKTLFSLHETRWPTLIGIVALLLGASAKWVLVPRYGATLVPGITSIVHLGAMLLQLVLIRRRLGRAAFAAVGHALRVYGLATLVAIGCGWVITSLAVPKSGLVGLAIGGLAYGGALRWLQKQETSTTVGQDVE